jgi:hypothetical protein
VLPSNHSLTQKEMLTHESDISDVPYTPCKREHIKCLFGGHVPPFPHLLECKFHNYKSLIKIKFKFGLHFNNLHIDKKLKHKSDTHLFLRWLHPFLLQGLPINPFKEGMLPVSTEPSAPSRFTGFLLISWK